jgi:hypothetical protein
VLEYVLKENAVDARVFEWQTTRDVCQMVRVGEGESVNVDPVQGIESAFATSEIQITRVRCPRRAIAQLAIGAAHGIPSSDAQKVQIPSNECQRPVRCNGQQYVTNAGHYKKGSRSSAAELKVAATR